MSSSYSDDDYANDLDHLIGTVEGLQDPAAQLDWGTGTMGDVIGPDHLPAHAPCLAAMRLLKTCMRSSKKGMVQCQKELTELETCSIGFFREMNRKLPKVACEAEKEMYFSIEVGGPKTLKEAKKAWQDLFNCAKGVETELNRSANIKRPQL